MAADVIFPTWIPNGTIDSADLIMFADVSASNATKDCTVASLPVSTATQTALDGKVDENASITGATKTKITYDAKGLVTAGADATTADIAASTDKNYVTDAQAVVIGNTSGINSGNQTITNSSDATSHTVTLSATGGSLKLVEGSNITLTTTGTGADGIVTIASSGGSGTGDVVWPASAVDSNITAFDTTTGKLIKDSLIPTNRAINSLGMGLVTGGALSINADTTKFDLSAGNGIIIDSFTSPNSPTITNVSWSTFTAQTVTNLATSTVTYILINSSGAIVQQTTYPTDAQHRDNIFIGQLGHTNLTNIATAINAPDFALSSADQVRDLGEAVGIINSGNVVSANGANLSINKASGALKQSGINFQTDNKTPSVKNIASATAPTFRHRTQTGNGSSSTTLDVGNYDVGWTITAVSGTKFQNFRVFLGVTGNIVIQYWQAVYTTMGEAIAGLQTESFVQFANLQNYFSLIGIIVARSTATDLSSATQAKFLTTSKFWEVVGAASGTSVSTLQQAYDNSLSPEILTDATRGALSIKRGSGADTDTVIEGLNWAWTTTFSVTGEGISKSVNFVPGFTTTATAAGTTTLTASSTYFQDFTGSTTQTVVMPVASTMSLWQWYFIRNGSSGLITVQSSWWTVFSVMEAGTYLIVFCKATSGTDSSSWARQYQWAIVASGKKLSASNSLTLAGTDGTTMTFPSTSATIARTDAANTFTGVQTMTSPVFASPTLGTPSSGTLTNCTADGTNAVGFKTIPQNSKSAAYTTVLGDSGYHIYHPSADTTARTWTIDSNANVAYPIGTAITFVNDTSAWTLTIAITSDTLVLAGAGTTGSRTLAASWIATAIKVTSTRWLISGTNLT